MLKLDLQNIRSAYLTKDTSGNRISGSSARLEDVRLLAEKINEIIEWSKKFENLDDE